MTELKPNRPYSEICDEVRNMKSIVNFDDIQVGEFYHIPPFYHHKRCDFYVLEKHENFIKCQQIVEGYKFPYIDHKYKSTFELKFATKHKNVTDKLKIDLNLPF